jgi:hypothetical protein
MLTSGILRRHLEKVQPIGGYSPQAIGPHESGMMITAGFHHSGEDVFHRLIEQYWGIYCVAEEGPSFPPELVADTLAVIHSDLSADVFAGCIPKELKFKAKRSIAANARIPRADLADVTEQRFIDIDILPTDSVVYCFRVGWRFGLYFDFAPTAGIYRESKDEVYRALGNAHRFLMFFDEYSAHEDGSATGLWEDGWFPFMHLLGGQYRRLADYYVDPNGRRFVDGFINNFTPERLTEITDGWWSNPAFRAKKEILLAGIDSFLLGTQRGAIACLKVLYSELEGLIRLACCKERNVAKPSFADLMNYVEEKGRERFEHGSLGFPQAFYRYLREQVFANFDLATNDIPLSRHSSLHGVADTAIYTRARALQAILTLDQLYFYLPNDDEDE